MTMHSRVLVTVLAVLTLAATARATTCDIFDNAPEPTPCVAAHSTVRALYMRYSGPLYQVRRASDNTTMDVMVLEAGGFANAASQDKFCAGTDCVIWRIYDQSPRNNHLDIAPPGEAHPERDSPCNATRASLTVGGHKVYSAYFEGGMGYRIDKGNGTAQGNNPETLYAVVNGKHFNTGCCFDYGNAESNNRDTGAGSMEAVYFGSAAGWGKGGGNGPWVMADLENGLWAGNQKVNPGNKPQTSEYVTAMVKGGTDGFGLKGGDAAGGLLTTLYDGPRPAGYQPMKKQGSIILGIGGDNSDWAHGTFYEGCMTAGVSSAATDAAVQANIVAAGYGK